jgi:hypothetical protein
VDKPKWESEGMNTRSVPDNIVCRTCRFKKPSVTIGGVERERYTHSACLIYEPPNYKPNEILWEHAECEYYEKG